MSRGPSSFQRVGRYLLSEPIASGGMARVHLGRLLATAGFSRTVAIKRLHPHFAESGELVSMLVDEARLSGRIQHPNVVATLDVFAHDTELLLVMEYVVGDSLAGLSRALRANGDIAPVPIAAAVMAGALHGLHAAHEATSESGEPLMLVHRDVSPQNILVGTDGHARVLDFGVAKARGRVQTTREGQVKGKLAYMAPEQIQSGTVTRRTDIFAAAIVLWELLTGRRLFFGDNEGQTLANVLGQTVEPPSRHNPSVPRELDEILARGLARSPEDRFETARAFALAIESSVAAAPPTVVGSWVDDLASEGLAARRATVIALEAARPEALPPSGQVVASDPDGVTKTDGLARSAIGESTAGANVDVDVTRIAPEDAPPARTTSRLALVLAAVASTVVVVVVLIQRLAMPADGNATAATSLPAPTADAAVVAPSANPIVVSAPSRVTIAVTSTPAGATLSLGGVEKGKTPMSLDLDRSSTPLMLEVVLEGYERHARAVKADEDQQIDVVLQQAARSRPYGVPPRAGSPKPGTTSAEPQIHRFD